MLNNLRQYLSLFSDININLHLKLLESLIKYFFAHDHLDYVTCYNGKCATKQFQIMEGIRREKILYVEKQHQLTSIGPDHGTEQENKRLQWRNSRKKARAC